MSTQANGFLTARRPKPQLTMCWQLRAGVLVQVWSLAAAAAATRWSDDSDAPRLAA